MGEPYVGEIRIFAGSFAPAGWMTCDGQLLPISENETLFQLIGTTYGGDGESTFALPNLQSRVPIHSGTGSDGNNYQPGEMLGVESVTLSTNQMPIHSHAMLATTDGGLSNSPGGNILANCSALKLYTASAPNTSLNASGVTATGGSVPHSNIQPYLALTFIISLFGVYPPPA